MKQWFATLPVAAAAAVVVVGTGAGVAAAAQAPVLAWSPPSPFSLAAARDASGGTWGTAEEVPDTAALNVGGHAGVYSLSCASADHCSAGGTYQDSSGHHQTFVVSKT